MAATAAAPAIGPPAPSALPPPAPTDRSYKNRLQEFTVRIYPKLPKYSTVLEGEHHQPKFRCTVQVGDEQFSSASTHSRRKEAEQDAARVAFESLVKRHEDVFCRKKRYEDVLGLIDQDVVFCKSILNEFAAKIKAAPPVYSEVPPQGRPMTLFAWSVSFDGNTYYGEAAASKKVAMQKAARAAVKSILATDNNGCILEIIKSKEKLITAIKEGGAATHTKALPPFPIINFVRPVGDGQNGEPTNVVPLSQAGSSQILYNPVNKKRKNNRTVGPQA